MDDRQRELRVTHEAGTRFRIGVRQHEFLVDQPHSAQGTDSAPTPTELFVASLASCTAYHGRTYLARRGLPDRVDVTAGWQMGKAPDRVTSVSLVIDAPGVPADRLAVFRRVVESCLVHNTVLNGCDVRLELGGDTRVAPVAG